MISSHGNPERRWTLFDVYLFKYCSVKYQTFHQVSEKTSHQTKNHLKKFPDASKSHKTSTILSDGATSGSFLIGRRGILVIPRNCLVKKPFFKLRSDFPNRTMRKQCNNRFETIDLEILLQKVSFLKVGRHSLPGKP